MADVARLAGVSQQTVSRVVNDYPHVSADKRERVLKAVEQLQYRPNTVARALATNRTMRLGVITYALAVTGPSMALLGVSEEARSLGYGTNLVTLADVSEHSLQDALRHLSEAAVEGAVLLAPLTETSRALHAIHSTMPVVSFEQGGAGGAGTVALDEVFAAQLATRHLLQLGHETVHLVRGPEHWMATEARETGWRRELALTGRAAPEPVRAANWGVGSGYEAGRELAKDPEVTAILVSNDAMCLGVYTALREVGRSVPEDVSVVGFDDLPEAAFYDPPLTTVHLDFVSAGRVALRRLMTLLGVQTPGEMEPPVPYLVERESTARPSSR